MSENPGGLIRFIRAVLGLFASTTIQGAVCLSVGGALTYVGILVGCPPSLAPLLLLAGMAVPLWPLRVYYSPERILERKFARWDRWVEKGQLSRSKCKVWKEAMQRWYASQLPSSLVAQEATQVPPRLEEED
jgi:hypothetical protein